ncbi:ribonuclease H-like domain-containing protein [Mycena pura]|uniref:Ribonuclease H-like domain-containing protein n=1 Tax=Mycena pura TaxID=153505 RepID=A0AAD6YP28_9AGAR|nr:ribonuclease H-like domain-containing protein [Mycena pura]
MSGDGFSAEGTEHFNVGGEVFCVDLVHERLLLEIQLLRVAKEVLSSVVVVVVVPWASWELASAIAAAPMDTIITLFHRCLSCFPSHLPSMPASPLPASPPSPLPSSPLPAPPLPPSPLPAYPTPHYIFIDTLDDANNHLRTIADGAIIGFDLESTEIPGRPKLTKAEKKSKLRNEIQDLSTFSIDWSKVDVCVAQIATVDNVYVIHIRKIGELPAEFSRICKSPLILKVSAGIFCDGQRLWDSFRLNLLSVASLGLLIKLAYPLDIHRKLPYGNEPALSIVVRHALGYQLGKELQNSAWDSITLSEAQKQYAAADVHATFASYHAVQLVLNTCGSLVDRNWYRYDVVNHARVREGNTGAWKPECPWWSVVEGIYMGRNT